jgi:hypothetical protein
VGREDYDDEEPLPRRRRRLPDEDVDGIGTGSIVAIVAVSALGVVAVVLLLLLALGVFSRKSPSDSVGWQEVVSPEGRFRVTMPGQPRKEIRTVQSQVGPVTDTNFGFDTNEWSIGVRYADFDGPGHLATPIEEIIKAGRDSTVKSLKGFVLSEKDISISGHPGREVVVEVLRRGTTYLRWCAVNRRIYTLIFMNNFATSSKTEVNRFFDSFQITE